MTNQQIARILFNVAALLDEAQDNLYRVRAYRRAALRVLALPEQAEAILARGEELPAFVAGARIRRKLAELIARGTMAFYDELLDEQPRHVGALMRIDGVGPVTARRLHDALGVVSPRDLLEAADGRQIRRLHGFGPRREAALADAARARLSTEASAA